MKHSRSSRNSPNWWTKSYSCVMPRFCFFTGLLFAVRGFETVTRTGREQGLLSTQMFSSTSLVATARILPLTPLCWAAAAPGRLSLFQHLNSKCQPLYCKKPKLGMKRDINIADKSLLLNLEKSDDKIMKHFHKTIRTYLSLHFSELDIKAPMFHFGGLNNRWNS